jgi:hypothetical protein
MMMMMLSARVAAASLGVVVVVIAAGISCMEHRRGRNFGGYKQLHYTAWKRDVRRHTVDKNGRDWCFPFALAVVLAMPGKLVVKWHFEV